MDDKKCAEMLDKVSTAISEFAVEIVTEVFKDLGKEMASRKGQIIEKAKAETTVTIGDFFDLVLGKKKNENTQQ